MKIKTSLLICMLVLTRLAQAQEICIKNNPLLNFLYNDTSAISAVDNYDQQYKFKFLKSQDKRLEGCTPRIIKSKNKLYYTLDATGIVYEATSATKESICFTRIDSTHYTGYNGNAIIFEHNDTIFSFGGDGFWRINGQLRFFSKLNHEWNVLQINKEIPAQSFLYQLNENNTKLYYLQIPFVDPVTGFKHTRFIITLMDIRLRKNTELGELNPIIASMYPDPYKFTRVINAPSLQGTFVAFNIDNIFLLDFEKNEVFRLVSPKAKDAFFGNSTANTAVHTFEEKGTIYYCYSNDSTYQLYSFPISRKDFIKEPYPLYIPFRPFYKNPALIFSFGILLILIGLAWFYNRKNKNKLKQEIIKPSTTQGNLNEMDFTPLELQLILKMSNNSGQSKAMTVEEINMALGLSKKTIEIQKKIRTETINRINHKFKILFNNSSELIERVRMENDRRYYSYQINEENITIFLEWHGSQKLT